MGVHESDVKWSEDFWCGVTALLDGDKYLRVCMEPIFNILHADMALSSPLLLLQPYQ